MSADPGPATIEVTEPAAGNPQPPSADPDAWQRLSIRVVWANAVIFLISVLPTLLALHPDTSPSPFGDWPAFIATTIGVVRSCADLWRWLRTRYRITEDRVELRTGRLVRKYRWVPRDRIRRVDRTAKLRHRVARLRVVHIASGDADGTLRLDAVPTAAAERLSRELMRERPDAADAAAPEDTVGSETVLATLRWSWFPYNAVNVWALPVGVLFIVSWSWLLMGFSLDPVGFVRDLVGWQALGRWEKTGVALGGTFAAGVVGLAFNFVTSKWGFQLVRATTAKGTVLLTRHGLLKTHEVHREDRRLRGVLTSEPLLWRWLGVTETEVISTGLGWSSGEPASSILPRTLIGEARHVAGLVLTDGVRPLEAVLDRHPRAALYRRLWWAVLGPGLTAVVLAASGMTVGGRAWFVVVALVASLGGAVIAYRTLGHTVVGPYVVLRCGLWRRLTVALERRAIIGWTLRQSMLQRWLGLVTVGVATAAGSRYFTAPDMGTRQALAFITAATPLLATDIVESSEPVGDVAGLRTHATVSDDPTVRAVRVLTVSHTQHSRNPTTRRRRFRRDPLPCEAQEGEMRSIFPHTESRRVLLRPASDRDQASFLGTLMRTGIESVRPGSARNAGLAGRCDAAFTIALRATGEHIGFGTLHALDPAGHIRCGVYVDSRRARLGLGAEAVHLLVNYAFASFNVTRVITQTTEASFDSFGLSVEDSRLDGRLPNHVYFRGQLWDLHNSHIERKTWERYIDRGMDGVLPRSVSWRRSPHRPARVPAAR